MEPTFRCLGGTGAWMRKACRGGSRCIGLNLVLDANTSLPYRNLSAVQRLPDFPILQLTRSVIPQRSLVYRRQPLRHRLLFFCPSPLETGSAIALRCELTNELPKRGGPDSTASSPSTPSTTTARCARIFARTCLLIPDLAALDLCVLAPFLPDFSCGLRVLPRRCIDRTPASHSPDRAPTSPSPPRITSDPAISPSTVRSTAGWPGGRHTAPRAC
jgi:hypothetical protein